MEKSIGVKIPNSYGDKGGKRKKRKKRRRKKTKPLKRTSQRRKSKIGAAPTGRANLGFNQPLFGPRRINASSYASRALMIGGSRRPFVFTPRATAHSRRNHLLNLATFTKPPVTFEEFARTQQTWNIFRHLQQTDDFQPQRAAAAQMGHRLGGPDRVRGRRRGVPLEAGIIQGEPIVEGIPQAEPVHGDPIVEGIPQAEPVQAAPPPQGPVEPRHHEMARYIMAQEAGLVAPDQEDWWNALPEERLPPIAHPPPEHAAAAARRRLFEGRQGAPRIHPRPPRSPRQPSRADREIAEQETITRRTRGRPREAADIPSYEGDAPEDDPDDSDYEV